MAGNHFTPASLFRQVKAYAAFSPTKGSWLVALESYGGGWETFCRSAENMRLAPNSTAAAVSSQSRFVRTRAAVVVWTHAVW